MAENAARRYIAKPIVIEAVQIGGQNGSQVIEFLRDGDAEYRAVHYDHYDRQTLISVDIRTLNGWVTANNSDYIIRGTHGDHYPCDSAVFDEKYRMFDQHSDNISALKKYEDAFSNEYPDFDVLFTQSEVDEIATHRRNAITSAAAREKGLEEKLYTREELYGILSAIEANPKHRE